jgi:hypothetical protein
MLQQARREEADWVYRLLPATDASRHEAPRP